MGIQHVVQDFYEDMPFNFHGAARDAAANVRVNPLRSYEDLTALLDRGDVQTVLEIGCGAGWASNSVALHYGKAITSVDFCSKALGRAQVVASELGIDRPPNFTHSDLFAYEAPHPMDLVMSLGVLHHTVDCKGALTHISRFIKPQGHLYLGLYHNFGRVPFLDHMHKVIETKGEEAAFALYKEMNPTIHDETHLRSWFRDQVLHPHETQHSLQEVVGWFGELGLTLKSTSINGFAPFDSLDELFELEEAYEEISIEKNIHEKIYFPGFFTALAVRDG